MAAGTTSPHLAQRPIALAPARVTGGGCPFWSPPGGRGDDRPQVSCIMAAPSDVPGGGIGSCGPGRSPDTGPTPGGSLADFSPTRARPRAGPAPPTREQPAHAAFGAAVRPLRPRPGEAVPARPVRGGGAE